MAQQPRDLQKLVTVIAQILQLTHRRKGFLNPKVLEIRTA
jgi:hypothetical protein